ncbi:MAG: hypothetical protein EZS28_018410 [Streblomastix strix]|uniref:Uncharacterized protein n=1 Tax=Streblomastix strix TaxID=222440 RepID=A0A5J4VTV2_9EUKA|nr:MAG: hypothetical protein EZS28_018410 [Streblomastix strix]
MSLPKEFNACGSLIGLGPDILLEIVAQLKRPRDLQQLLGRQQPKILKLAQLFVNSQHPMDYQNAIIIMEKSDSIQMRMNQFLIRIDI